MNPVMRTLWRWLAAVLFCCAGAPAPAQQAAPQRLTPDDCIRLALAAPSTVRLAQQDRDIAALGVQAAHAGYFPRLQSNIDFNYNSPLINSRGVPSYVALNGVREYVFNVQATEEVDTSGRLRAEVRRARADHDIAAAGVAISQRGLKRAVTAAYYRLLLVRHVAQALRDSLAEAQSFEERTQKLIEGGEAAHADLVRASAQAAQFRAAAAAAELDAQIASHELAAFWTADVSAPLDVADVFQQLPAPEPDLAPGGSQPVFLQRPEFQLFDAQRRGFLADARRTKAGLFPQLNFSLQWGLDTNQVRWDQRGYAAFFNLTIPIFDWKRTLRETRQFELRAAQTDTNRELAHRLFSRDLQNAYARERVLYQQIELARTQVRLGQENVRLSRLRFEGGEGSAQDVVAAQAQLAQARVDWYNAISSYLNARADREVAAGR
jgi:outer membrane protein TolC